jgi:hypothetical protein
MCRFHSLKPFIGERGEAKIRSRQTRLNAVDERCKIDRSVKRRRGGEPSTNCFFFFIYLFKTILIGLNYLLSYFMSGHIMMCMHCVFVLQPESSSEGIRLLRFWGQLPQLVTFQHNHTISQLGFSYHYHFQLPMGRGSTVLR